MTCRIAEWDSYGHFKTISMKRIAIAMLHAYGISGGERVNVFHL